MSYAVSRRTREIGVRMALGARARNVLQMILKEAIILVVLGMATGWIAAAIISRLLAGFLYGISPLDAITFVFIPIVLVLVALVASYLPARRATKVDPIVALRYE